MKFIKMIIVALIILSLPASAWSVAFLKESNGVGDKILKESNTTGDVIAKESGAGDEASTTIMVKDKLNDMVKDKVFGTIDTMDFPTLEE